MSEEPRRRSGLTGTVIRGVSLAGSGFLLGRVITLVTFVVLARLITPEELGQYTSGSILVGFGLLLAGSGMLAALIHREDRLDEAASTATAATIGAGVVLALVGLATAPLLGIFFGSDTVAAVAAASAGILFLQSARTVPRAILQRRFSFLRRLIVEPIAMIAFGVASIVATSKGLGVWGLVIGQYAYAVVDLALSWGMSAGGHGSDRSRSECGGSSSAYGRHVLAGTTIRRFGDQVPVFVSGGMLSTSAVGQLQYANRIVTTPYSLIVTGISYVIFPAFARIANDRSRFKPALPAIAAVGRAGLDADRADPRAARRAAGDRRLRRALEPRRRGHRRDLPVHPRADDRRGDRRGLQGHRHPGQADPRERDRGHGRCDHDDRPHAAAGPLRGRDRDLGRRDRRRRGRDRAREQGDGDPGAERSSRRSLRPRPPPC